jgi:alkanesulfonate monooxygenase
VSSKLFWTLPPRGDGVGAVPANFTRGDFQGARRRFSSAVHDARNNRFNYYDYLSQTARAAETTSFDGVAIPWDAAGEEPWIVAGALVREARRLEFVPELKVGFATPVYLAKMSASFQRLSGNRLSWKLNFDRDHAKDRALGDLLTGADWLARADEYLEAAKGVFGGKPYEFRGRFFEVEAGGFDAPLAGVPAPRIYTAGVAEGALALAAKHSDVHFLEAGAVEDVRAQIEHLGGLASRHTRGIGAALELGVVARHRAEEADEALTSLRREAGPNASLRVVDSDDGVALWTGFDALGFGTRAALVGSYDAVARRLDQYRALGLDSLFLTSNPHLEGAYRLGEHVLSKLASRARSFATLAASGHTSAATGRYAV